MPTVFSLTLDSVHGSLVVVAGERILDDVSDVRITRRPEGGFDCELTRAGKDAPTKLVAAASPAGKQALERASGQECVSAPGFVEVPTVPMKAAPSLADEIARFLGWEPTTGD